MGQSAIHGRLYALIGAESKETAEKALELIEVEYEPLPLVDNPEHAMLESSLLCMRPETSIIMSRLNEATRK